MQRIKNILWSIILLLGAIYPLEAATCHPFKIDVTADEKENITYIVHTLASNSTLGLWKYQKDLEAAGAKTKGVSGLEFFAYILQTPNLKADLKKIIEKGGLPYKRFVNGFTPNFLKEAVDPCFDTTFSGFCKTCKLDESRVKPVYLQGVETANKKSGAVPFGPFIRAIVQ